MTSSASASARGAGPRVARWSAIIALAGGCAVPVGATAVGVGAVGDTLDATAQAPPGVAASVPPRAPSGLEARIAERVAESWGVPARGVCLAWARAARMARLDAETPFRIVGRGVDGWFAITFRPFDSDPETVRARAGIADTIGVATRALAVSDRLVAADFGVATRIAWGPPARERALAPAPGWEVRRALAAGDRLAWPAVVPPPLVASGDPVRMTWSSGRVSISLAGVALNAARKGEVVKVRVDGRSERLTGTVVGPGVAVLGSGGQR